MNKLLSKQTESDLLKLGLYQIFGGAIGILILAIGIFKSSLFSGLSILILFFILLFFSYSVVCGVLCIRGSVTALKHSLINQILQVIGFAAVGFAFKYVAGIYLTVGLDLTDSFNFSYGAGISKFSFNFNLEKDRLELDLNLVAVCLVYWIERLIKRVKEENEVREVSEIGYN